jgi:hypothetical protein
VSLVRVAGATTCCVSVLQMLTARHVRSVVAVGAASSYSLEELQTRSSVHTRSVVAVGAMRANSLEELQTECARHTRSDVDVGATNSNMPAVQFLDTRQVVWAGYGWNWPGGTHGAACVPLHAKPVRQ